MSTIRRFEDIHAWQESRALCRGIYALSAGGPFARDNALRHQIRKAAVSVMSNIAEGFERNGDREFIQFLSQAKGSAGEVRAQLYVALDQGYIPEPEFRKLRSDLEGVSSMLSRLMAYLGESSLRGPKFRQPAAHPPPAPRHDAGAADPGP